MKLCRVLNYWATRPNNESRLFSLPSVPALVYNDAMISGNVASVMREDAGKETAETDQVVVAVSDVCFSYGDHEVLHNVSFEITAKSLVAVVGPNGGGKTTLIKLMMGTLKPRFGKIKVFGKNPENSRVRMGFVPQQINFDPDFPITVLEAVMLGRSASHVLGGFRRADREAAEKAIQAVGLDGLSQNLFSELSGGQRQRILIAQALCSDPEILLLDEPTANVDPETERSLYELFKELNKTKTIVIVSHNLRVVIAHATHIICVDRSVDMHRIGEDEHTELVPVQGCDAYSFINDSKPDHLFGKLNSELAAPHRGEQTPQ